MATYKKVKITAPGLMKLKDEMSKADFHHNVALFIINEMKRFIRIGTSPVKGERRFDAYKDAKKYPGDLKNRRPVNLELSGRMLQAITYKPIKDGVKIGIWDSIQAQKARTHLQGLNGVPKRKFMPVEENDQFIVSIQRDARYLYLRKIYAILKG